MPQAQALKAFDAFATQLAAADRFSGVLVVEQNGERLYEKPFGIADRESNSPARLDTPFLFASQGKMFTAVSVLQLIEAGKLGFDDPVGKYLKDYPNEEMAKVTIRQLLSHQGGTGDIGVLQPDEGANRAWVRTLDDLVKLNGDRAPAFRPGSGFEYSNYGFVLLGALVDAPSRTQEVAVLVAANLGTGLVRFFVFRVVMVGRNRRRPQGLGSPGASEPPVGIEPTT